MSKTKIETLREKRFLKCTLTEEEKKILGEEMAQAVYKKENFEGEIKNNNMKLKEQIKEGDIVISDCAEKIRTGYETREIEVEKVIDRAGNKVIITRIDTGEIIEERELTYNERQMHFGGVVPD